jgi:hypothetical protein
MADVEKKMAKMRRGGFVKAQNGLRRPTYAQNACCSAQDCVRRSWHRYQSNSEAKSLIYMEFELCPFYGHSSQSLDFQGLAASPARFSTKLSTETLDGPQSTEKSMT